VLEDLRRQPVPQRVTCVPKVNLEKKMVLIYVLNAMQVGMRIILVQQRAQFVLAAQHLRPAPQRVTCVPKVNLELPVVLIHVLNALLVDTRLVPGH